jgi:hypothetical protein
LAALTVELDTVRPVGVFAGAAMPEPLMGYPGAAVSGSRSSGPTTPVGGAIGMAAPTGCWIEAEGPWNPKAKTEKPTTTAAERLRKAIRPGPITLGACLCPP